MARVFQAYLNNSAKYFLAQEWSSGTLQIHSHVEFDGLRFYTASIFNSKVLFNKQLLIIKRWSHSRRASEPCLPTSQYPWTIHFAPFQTYLLPSSMLSICGCQHTECHLSDTELLGAGAAHPARLQLNIWIYAWSVCEGYRLNAITVMLRVNLSFGGRCPAHTYRRCTALGDK